MITEDERIKQIAKKWNALIENMCAHNLSDIELSSLSSWIVDCYESYKEIYMALLERILTAPPDDYDLLHDCVVDIYWQLNHIKDHIDASEKGFSELMRRLADSRK